MRHARFRHWPRADESVLRLKKHVHARGNEVGHERRNADAEIHQHPVAQFLRDALAR